MKILFLEPFYGGSHKSVANGFAAHSCHEVKILSLPPRFWKWRMRGAGLYFARQVKDIGRFDLVLATDMMDLTDFKALVGQACPPIALYFHENQLSYPLSPGEKRDFHLGFTNIVSAAAADLVLFNTRFHEEDFFRAAKSLIRQMPDARPTWLLDSIRARTRVLYPGCRIPAMPPEIPEKMGDAPPLVVWNHRWEHDKKPEVFFRVMARMKKQGIPFRLAVLGERYEDAPAVFKQAEAEFAREMAVFGFQSSAADYRAWLSQGDCVVSTAVQENFGISVVEAMAHGCFPLLPDRLSYPELIPEGLHDAVLYQNQADLEGKLAAVLSDPSRFRDSRRLLAAHVCQFSWEAMIRVWDRVLADLIQEVC